MSLFVTDCEEGQPVLSEHLHPGRNHESGVSRDDVGGHCLPASQGPGRHGEAPLIPHQVMTPAQTSQLCSDWITDPSFMGFFIASAFVVRHLFFAKLHLMVFISFTYVRLNRMNSFLKHRTILTIMNSEASINKAPLCNSGGLPILQLVYKMVLISWYTVH